MKKSITKTLSKSRPSLLSNLPYLPKWHCALYTLPNILVNKSSVVEAHPNSARRYFQSTSIKKNTNTGGSASTTGLSVPEEILKLTQEQYQKVSDMYLESLLDELEAISEENYDLIPEVELNQGVLNFEIKGKGSYVVNKQPPNKQIWLSSPISGPNRFDFYQNNWISLRDNTNLTKIINKELQEASNGKYSLSI
ncbi:Frataxin, mitochondrial [Hanseniaspora osmophila]|uniref:ferroxidase n=1 Tax=Hanseniaspora osmophila TaxID=56408 RepID=A0A1E5RN45_9ASCO|nr:Frataxin, mitochondrial [Hanseniaspora osmophila]